MAKFDLGAFAQTLQSVPNSGTSGAERIEYIPLAELHADKRNFYALSGVEDLAANIQLCGLMDPLRVRKADDGYTIVSGHRRFAALSLLAKEDNKFSSAACIVEPADVPQALQELRLIYANSDTRRMSGADISKQAERVEALLYQLKAEGMEFPGRMRDHVAEACKVSKSKLSRLAVIRDRLAPDIRKAYWEGGEKGRLNESTAYELARLPVDLQRQISDRYRCKNGDSPGLRWLSSRVPERVAEYTKGFGKLRCPQSGEGCSHRAGKEAHIVAALVKDTWARPNCNRLCCADCPTIASCRDICPKCKDKQRQVKAENKAEKQQAKLDQEAHDRPIIEQIQELWRRFTERRQAVGISAEEYSRRLDCPYMASIAERFEGGEAITTSTPLPYGYNSYASDVTYWSAAADALGCSVDYLMGRTDDPLPLARPVAGQQMLLAGWMPGGTNPGHPCECLVIIDLDSGDSPGKWVKQTAYYKAGNYYFGAVRSSKIEMPILAWMEIPTWKRGDKR